MSSERSPQALVDTALNQIVGLPAWDLHVGVGSFLEIEFGRPATSSVGVPRGEFHLWVYGALWVIREGRTVITSSEASRVSMSSGAELLNSSVVQSFDYDHARMTLKVRIGRHELVISPLGDPDMEEWMLYLNDGNVLVAGPGDSINCEPAGRT